jgi:hypothetical protein
MDDKITEKKRPWIKRLSGPLLFVLVLLTYFTSEALLRRILYELPREQSSDKTKLIQMLPSFLQGYLREYTKRLELKERLKETADPEKRAEILFELASKSGSEKANMKAMMRVIDEIPHSTKALPAWAMVLKNMSGQEILDKYVPYIMNCDIRTPREKVRVWQAGAIALAGRSKDARFAYVREMAKNRICSEELARHYEELWIECEASGDLEMGEIAKNLKSECAAIAMRKMRSGKKKR